MELRDGGIEELLCFHPTNGLGHRSSAGTSGVPEAKQVNLLYARGSFTTPRPQVKNFRWFFFLQCFNHPFSKRVYTCTYLRTFSTTRVSGMDVKSTVAVLGGWENTAMEGGYGHFSGKSFFRRYTYRVFFRRIGM